MVQKANGIRRKIDESSENKKDVFGEGRPKICVPITGRTREEIALRMAELKAEKPDLAEWRADWYEEVFDRKKTGKHVSVAAQRTG